LKAVYPAVWGVLQVVTGPLSNRWGRKGLIVAGMWVQAAGIFVTVLTRNFQWWLLGSFLLGLGTAMVYPSLIAAVFGLSWAIGSVGALTFLSGAVVALAM
jgi:MFS family permease